MMPGIHVQAPKVLLLPSRPEFPYQCRGTKEKQKLISYDLLLCPPVQPVPATHTRRVRNRERVPIRTPISGCVLHATTIVHAEAAREARLVLVSSATLFIHASGIADLVLENICLRGECREGNSAIVAPRWGEKAANGLGTRSTVLESVHIGDGGGLLVAGGLRVWRDLKSVDGGCGTITIESCLLGGQDLFLLLL